MGYLLSIVIPTKDRYEYLEQLIDLIISFHSNDIEVIIQDNTHDNERICSFLKERDTTHIKYYHTADQISISLNSDKAILNSSGKYVCFIGDDDGVTRYVVDCVKWMDEKGIGVLRSEYAIHKWPSYRSPKPMKISGTVLTGNYDNLYIIYDSMTCLKKLLSTGINNMLELPKVYNGIVRRDILDRIYNKCETFFPGPSPDMANSVALCLVEEKFCKVNAPVIIGGHSSHLGGDTHRYTKNWGPLNEQKFISQKDQDNWSKMIPKVWSGVTVWPQSAISAIKAFDREDLLKEIDYDEVLAAFIEHCPEIKEMAYEIKGSREELDRRLKRINRKNFIHKIKMGIGYYLCNKSNGLRIHRNINNIAEAEKYLVNHYTFSPKD